MAKNPRQDKPGKPPTDTAMVEPAVSIPAETGSEVGDSSAVERDGNDDTSLSPLDVILEAMRLKWQKGEHDAAVSLAKTAVPYVHRKVNGIREDSGAPIEGLSDEELIQLATGGGRTGDTPEDPEIADGVG